MCIRDRDVYVLGHWLLRSVQCLVACAELHRQYKVERPSSQAVSYTHLDVYKRQMLSRTAEQVESTGPHMVLIAEKSNEHTRGMEHPMTVFATRAEALTWAEDRILEQFGDPDCMPDNVHSTRSELLSTLAEDDVRQIRSHTEAVEWDAGTTLLRTGQKFSGVYMVTSGSVEVSRRSPQGDRVELEVIGPCLLYTSRCV